MRKQTFLEEEKQHDHFKSDGVSSFESISNKKRAAISYWLEKSEGCEIINNMES